MAAGRTLGPHDARWSNPYDRTARTDRRSVGRLAGAGAVAAAALAVGGTGAAHAAPDGSDAPFGGAGDSVFDPTSTWSFSIDDTISMSTFEVGDDDVLELDGPVRITGSVDARLFDGPGSTGGGTDAAGGSRRTDPDFSSTPSLPSTGGSGDGALPVHVDPLAARSLAEVAGTLPGAQFVPLVTTPAETTPLMVAFDDTPSAVSADLTVGEVALLTGSDPAGIRTNGPDAAVTVAGVTPTTTEQTTVGSTGEGGTAPVTNTSTTGSGTDLVDTDLPATTDRDDRGITAATNLDAGTATVVLGAGAAALTTAMEKLPGVLNGQTAKGVSTTVDKVVPALDPRQERALHALNTDPIGTLAQPDVLRGVLDSPARTLARNVGSEVGGGLLSLTANTALAPLGPLVQAPLGGVIAKAGQKEIIDPALDRALAPEKPSTVLAGADGTMTRPDGRTELQNPLLEATSSSPIDDQLTQVDGRPLTARDTPPLTTMDGRPLTAPNAFQRFVDGLTTQEVDTVTIYGADGRPLSSRPAVLGSDGRPVASSTSGAVLRPMTTFGGTELDEVLAEPGRTQRTALTQLGIPDARELRTPLPGDVDPATTERLAVDRTRDTAGARRAAGTVNPVPEDLAGATWTRTRGVGEPAPKPALSRSTVAAMVGEGTKQVLGVGLRTAGVPGAAVTAVDSVASACAAAVCGVVGKAAEEVAKGSNPGRLRGTITSAGRADFASNALRTATTLAPDQLLNLGATTGTGYLASKLPVADVWTPNRTAPPVRPTGVGGAGAVVAGTAAPFVRQGLVTAGLLPADPLRSDWRGQTATVLANIAEGAAGGITSRGDALTGAIGNGINSFRRDTTAGRQLDTFSRQQHTATGNPVVDRVRAVGSMATNGAFQVGNLFQVVPEAFTATGQTIGTLAGGVAFQRPLHEVLADLNASSGVVGTRKVLQEVVDTQLRYERNQREAALGVPQRPAKAPNGGTWCTDTTTRGCVIPGSVDPNNRASVGRLQQGKLDRSHPDYWKAYQQVKVGDHSRPGSPGYGKHKGYLVGPVYYGTGDGTPQDRVRTFARNMTTPAGVRRNVTTVVQAAVDHVRRDPAGAARNALRLLTGR